MFFISNLPQLLLLQLPCFVVSPPLPGLLSPCPQAFKAGGGWFDTGDLGWRAPQGVAGSAMAGNIVLTGVLVWELGLVRGERWGGRKLPHCLQSTQQHSRAVTAAATVLAITQLPPLPSPAPSPALFSPFQAAPRTRLC